MAMAMLLLSANPIALAAAAAESALSVEEDVELVDMDAENVDMDADAVDTEAADMDTETVDADAADVDAANADVDAAEADADAEPYAAPVKTGAGKSAELLDAEDETDADSVLINDEDAFVRLFAESTGETSAKLTADITITLTDRPLRWIWTGIP